VLSEADTKTAAGWRERNIDIFDLAVLCIMEGNKEGYRRFIIMATRQEIRRLHWVKARGGDDD